MKKIGILVKKEMTEILRDKKTLIIMVLIPLLLYPVLLIGMTLGINMIAQSQASKTYTIGYVTQDETFVEPIIEIYEREKDDDEQGALEFVAFESKATNEEEITYDVWMSFAQTTENIAVTVDYTSTDSNSNYTENKLNDLIDIYAEELVAQNLKTQGLTEEFLSPISYEAVDSVSMTESLGLNLGGMLGMLLITNILMGSFYPAVDVTTGEKERGTLETLLTLPVTNFQMIMSKFISVSTFACVTAVFSLLSIGGSIFFMMLALPADSGEGIQLPIDMFIKYLPILLLAMITTALLITAFSMCFCVFAKSSKEANNYMTPIMLIAMFASMISIIPTIEFNYALSLVPIVNVSLLLRDVFGQQMNLTLAGTTIFINAIYSVLIIWILAKMYDSEDILFSDGFRSIRILQKRSDIKIGTIPATGDLILGLVVLLLAMIYVGGAITARQVMVGAFVQQLMVLAVPLFLTWYMKTDKKQIFSLATPKLSIIPASILLYIGTYLLSIMTSVVLSLFMKESLQNVEGTFNALIEYPFVLVVFVLAFMPAVGEELLFRGVVFGSLNSRYKAVISILVSAAIFGAFHMSMIKFLSTGLLGACFAYIVYKGGSIYVTMFLHFVNNAFSFVAMKYPQVVGKVLPFLVKEELSSVELVIICVVAVICLGLGIALMEKPKKVIDNGVSLC